MVRIALGLEYDGRGFCGWQTQPGGCAIQDALENALQEIAGERINVHCAGRTDTGVHALSQVVHFDTLAERPDSAWVRGVNALLPPTVAVRWAKPVEAAFHARFSAEARRYRYVLLNRATRPALSSGRVGWFHAPLDVGAMQDAANFLLGEQDFSAFRAAECQAKTPVRTLHALHIRKQRDLIVFDLHANAFLHHMVRNIVGALVYVGKSKHPAQWMQELLQGRDRRLAAPTFAPDGLYLSGVDYAAHWNLPSDTEMVMEPWLE